VPSSGFGEKTENSLDYKLGRPHPGKAKKRKTPCFPRGGALIPDLGHETENAWITS